MLQVYGRNITMLLIVLCAGVAACSGQQDTPALPTAASAADTPAATVTEAVAVAPATWTPPPSPGAAPGGPLPTVAPRPSNTPAIFPSNTARPTATPPPSQTPTETATAVPSPTDLPPPISGNLLPNGSFEEGWYHIDGIPELQVPNGWQLAWDAGANPLDFDPAPWVRPESRVLNPDFLPTAEHDLFIWHGQQTVKIFKGSGAVSFRLTTIVRLEPGVYVLEIHVFPDLVDEYVGGQKVWAPDPLSGEVRLIAGSGGSDWILPRFGRKNSFAHLFRIESPQEVQVGAAMRGRWAILNNGWFMDDWRLTRVE